MAIFHCNCKIIARSKGHSAVAGSAYRNAVNLTNEYDGVDHRYEHKTGVCHSEIMLCENAPSEYQDRETLWNAVEKIERASDAQLAREYEFSIPRELKTREEQIEFVRNFVYENFVSKGMCADFSIHDKGDGNPHVHVMVTMRPLDENGKWENKSEQVYLCKNKAGEERAFSKSELEKDKSGEWQKQHHYSKNGDPKGKKIWLTEYEKNNNPKYKKYERIKNDRQPKTEKYGRQNPKIKEWNSKEFLIQVRSNLAAAINNELEKRGYEQRVDHRSYKEQGVKKIATIHEGKSARIREEKRNDPKYQDRYSEPTDRIEINKEIRGLNAELKQIEIEISELLYQKSKNVPEVKMPEQKPLERKKNIFERVIDSISSAASERSAKKKAEEQARKEAAETAKRAEEERLAAEQAKQMQQPAVEQESMIELPVTVSIRLDDFEDIFKKYGADIMLKEISFNEDTNQYKHTVVLREEDLPVLQTIVSDIGRQFKIEAIDKRIAELEALGDRKTDAHIAAIENLKKERATLVPDQLPAEEKTANKPKYRSSEDWNRREKEKALEKQQRQQEKQPKQQKKSKDDWEIGG